MRLKLVEPNMQFTVSEMYKVDRLAFLEITTMFIKTPKVAACSGKICRNGICLLQNIQVGSHCLRRVSKNWN